jgi:hypothetical protein
VVPAGLTLWDPDNASEPLQPPVALQDVEFDADQLRVVLPPEAIELGLAEIVAVGAGVVVDPTVTVTDLDADPPLPVHVSVYVVVEGGDTVWDPESGSAPE